MVNSFDSIVRIECNGNQTIRQGQEANVKTVMKYMLAGVLVAGVVFAIFAIKNKEAEPETIRKVIVLGPTSSASKPTEAKESVNQYQGAVIALMRQASHEYPVPYVREQLSEIFNGLDRGDIVIGTVLSYDSDDGNHHDPHAMLRHTADGRPMIVLFMLSNAVVINRAAEELGTSESAILDPALMDWYVTVFVHEWLHNKHGHRYDKSVTLPIHMCQESEAWFDTFANIIEPALAHGRFHVPLNLELAYGYACYKASGKDMKQAPWQAFVKWIAVHGPDEDVERLCLPPSLRTHAGTP